MTSKNRLGGDPHLPLEKSLLVWPVILLTLALTGEIPAAADSNYPISLLSRDSDSFRSRSVVTSADGRFLAFTSDSARVIDDLKKERMFFSGTVKRTRYF